MNISYHSFLLLEKENIGKKEAMEYSIIMYKLVLWYIFQKNANDHWRINTIYWPFDLSCSGQS